MSEIYVNINGFSNYQVSNFGNVKNIKTGRILKPGTTRWGYMYVVLTNNGDISSLTVHRLVATAFIENPENKNCVDHIDRDRLNNNIDNLRWATYEENGQNRTISKNNTSGINGVSFVTSRNKWASRITVNGVKKNLGRFVNKEDAIKARHDAEILYFQEFRAV